MALLKAVALGAIGAIAAPFALHDAGGTAGMLVRAGTYHPPAGSFAFAVSAPIFLVLTGFCWLLLKAGEGR